MSKNTTGTAEEKAIHKEATRLRKMTDVQLVTAFKEAKEGNKKTEDNPVKTLIDGLVRGECPGIIGGNATKIINYAMSKGLL